MTKPAIIITIGNLAYETVQQIKPVYLQAEENRPLLTSILHLNEKNKLLEPDQIEISPKSQTPNNNANQGFADILGNNEMILNFLQEKFANLCSDNNLIQAGYSQLSDISLNLYLVADLTDPFEAAQAIGMVLIIQKWLEFDNRVNPLLEFNLALFDSKTESKTHLQAMVGDLNEILDPHSMERRNLLKQIGASGEYFNGIPAILLDRVKSNGTFIKNLDEMKIMMGNALYSLLQEDFFNQIEFLQDGPFASIGCSLLLLDPQDLIILSAEQCGTEFIQKQLLAPAKDSPQRLSIIESIKSELGTLDGWIQGALSKLPSPVTVASAQFEAMSTSLKMRDFNPPSMNYMNLPESTWVDYCRRYLEEFEKIKLKFLRKHLVEYFNTFKGEKNEQLKKLGDSLVSDSQLYPGGIKNAINVMENAHFHVDEFPDRINRYIKRAKDEIKAKLLDFETLSLRTQQLFSQAPKPPFFVKWLPKQIAEWFCLLYIPWIYKLKLLSLQNSINETVSILESICSMKILEKILLLINDIPSELMIDIDSIVKDYNKLYSKGDSKIDQVKSEYKRTNPEERKEIFRQSLAIQEWVDFGIQKWPVDNQAWLVKFLEDSEFKDNWRNLKDDFIPRWVFKEGLSHFQVWVHDANLGTIFNNFDDTKGILKLLAPIRAGRTPLLNPSFNATGHIESHAITNYLLIGDPEWVNSISEDSEIGTEQTIISMDPYTCGFICLECGIPLKALSLFRNESDKQEKVWRKFSLITNDGRKSVDILPGLHVTVSDVEGSEGDLIQKTFRWIFRPKGKPESFEQEIVLRISKKRFEEYKSKQRFNRDFNLYSEEEMPEIRDIALAFQGLHQTHEWSTYNQAFNILTFVQSCIPYSYDKDSTSHQDWARYPIETLMEGTGDCEDVAILCGAILARLGFSSALFSYPRHIAFGVQAADTLKGDYVEDPKNNKKYYYGEATAKGWRLGEIPSEYKSHPPDAIYPITLVVSE